MRGRRDATEETEGDVPQDILHRRAAFIAMLYKTRATISDSIQRTPDGGDVQSAAILATLRGLRTRLKKPSKFRHAT